MENKFDRVKKFVSSLEENELANERQAMLLGGFVEQLLDSNTGGNCNCSCGNPNGCQGDNCNCPVVEM